MVWAPAGHLCAALAVTPGIAEVTWGDWVPKTAGWLTLLDHRERQIKRIQSQQQRFDGYLALATAGLFVPNFTKQGYEVVRQPAGVHERLNSTLHAALAGGSAAEEGEVDQIAGPRRKFVALGSLNRELLHEMLPLHEAWAGNVRLQPRAAYGLRVYGPDNWLTMHFDRYETHVISSILHVDRDVDEPWPIVIEGYDGKTVEVDLRPGEMLFYESSKCLHGRPRPLKGKFYASLFLHYSPKDWPVNSKDVVDFLAGQGHYRQSLPPDDRLPAIRIKGTGWFEPGCPGNWCSFPGPLEPARKEL